VPDHLITPYGGQLVELITGEERATELQARSREWPSWNLTDRQLCDLELLLNGGFSPLDGFLGQNDYESVCDSGRLANGTLWPIPIVLDVTAEFADGLNSGDTITLRDPEGVMLAVLKVEHVWQPDLQREVESVYGSRSADHPGVRFLLEEINPFYVSGTLEGVQLPIHYDYRNLRQTPAELRSSFARAGWRRILAFRTRSSMHRAHHELTIRAAKDFETNVLIHPEIYATRTRAVSHFSRVRCYQAILPRYPQHTVRLSLLPLAARMAGPKEAILHGIIRRNYGCTHLIVGSDHAGPGKNRDGSPFYRPNEAQELYRDHEEELEVALIAYEDMVYVSEDDAFYPVDEVPQNRQSQSFSMEDLEERLETGREIPDWFTFPGIVRELRTNHPPRHKQGLTVFITGLSGAGKSTIANVLMVKFLEMGERPITLLDGDIVRKNLSSELGFSREHRDLNISRIGFVASEITKNGGIAICAPIAPYNSVRRANRTLIESVGGYQLVHVTTPIEVCEARDRKGLYAKARAGIIKDFTGISDPYEEPDDADVEVDTTELTPEEAAQRILLHLEKEGFIGASSTDR